MTSAMLAKLLEDPDFLEQAARSYEETLQAERQAREEFLRSETFTRMVSALRDNPNYVCISCEDAAYFLDKVKAKAGWDFATRENVDMFFNVLSRRSADTVEPGSESKDEDCMFDNCSFRHYGLNVSMMFGQGTAVVISNQVAPATT